MHSESSRKHSLYFRFGKRAFDVAGALVALPVLAAASIVAVPLIRLEDGGPALFKAVRRGRDGRPFTMYKFRSMSVNAPDLRNPDGSTVNGRGDIRVTSVGRILRKTSVDELPQIINVLRGDMSFVGPRPDMATRPLSELKGAERKRLEVRPGITGPSQVQGRNRLPVEERRRIDALYARDVSLSWDWRIVEETVAKVLGQKDIHS